MNSQQVFGQASGSGGSGSGGALAVQVGEDAYFIRENAEMSVRGLLKEKAKSMGTNVLSAVDYLDDGSPVMCFLIYSCER